MSRLCGRPGRAPQRDCQPWAPCPPPVSASTGKGTRGRVCLSPVVKPSEQGGAVPVRDPGPAGREAGGHRAGAWPAGRASAGPHADGGAREGPHRPRPSVPVRQVRAQAGQPLLPTFQRECAAPPCAERAAGQGGRGREAWSALSPASGSSAGRGAGPHPAAPLDCPPCFFCSFSHQSRDCPPCSHTQAPSGPCRALFSPRYRPFLAGGAGTEGPGGGGQHSERTLWTHVSPKGRFPDADHPQAPVWTAAGRVRESRALRTPPPQRGRSELGWGGAAVRSRQGGQHRGPLLRHRRHPKTAWEGASPESAGRARGPGARYLAAGSRPATPSPQAANPIEVTGRASAVHTLLQKGPGVGGRSLCLSLPPRGCHASPAPPAGRTPHGSAAWTSRILLHDRCLTRTGRQSG